MASVSSEAVVGAPQGVEVIARSHGDRLEGICGAIVQKACSSHPQFQEVEGELLFIVLGVQRLAWLAEMQPAISSTELPHPGRHLRAHIAQMEKEVTIGVRVGVHGRGRKRRPVVHVRSRRSGNWVDISEFFSTEGIDSRAALSVLGRNFQEKSRRSVQPTDVLIPSNLTGEGQWDRNALDRFVQLVAQ